MYSSTRLNEHETGKPDRFQLAPVALMGLAIQMALYGGPVAAAGQIATSSDTRLLEEVIVRGQRIEHSVQDTKESIAVITAETIEVRGLVNFADVLNQTAGVSGDGRSFRIRGIDSGPLGTLRSELASLYVDGVAMTGFAKSEGPQQLWDVAQVEVMRGPQSTNVGRNALAGAVIINTRDPVYENTAALRGGAGNYGGHEIAAMGNVSLIDGVSALRFTYEEDESDGFVENITRGEDDVDYDRRKTARLKWLLEPGDDLRLLFALQYADNDYGDSIQVFEVLGFDREDRIALADTRGRHPTEALQASLVLDYEISDRWHLKTITAAMDSERERTDDFDNTADSVETVGGVIQRRAEDKNWSQEVRFDYRGETVRGSSGFYFSRIDENNSNFTVTSLDLASFGLGQLVALGAYPAYFNLTTGGDTSRETTNMAAFSEWEMDLGNRWTLSFGARYDVEEQDVQFLEFGSSTDTLPDPADYANTPFGDLSGTINSVNETLESFITDDPPRTPESSYEAFLPHIGATYHWNEDVSTSFFVKRGYRAGGTEVLSTSGGDLNEYDPEYLLNYELALRAELLDGRAVLNGNLYFGQWKDQQVIIPLFPGSSALTRIENAGESEIAGLELDFRFQASEKLSLFATAGYSKTEFIDFISATNDYSGNEFALAPEVTAALGGTYTFEGGFFLHANLTYQGDSFADSANNLELDAHTLTNLRAGYTTGQLRAEAYGENLFDEQYATNRFQTFGTMGAPREYGVRLTYHF